VVSVALITPSSMVMSFESETSRLETLASREKDDVLEMDPERISRSDMFDTSARPPQQRRDGRAV
jgi:hypothetical protein